jgi:hypothetical protein
MKSLFGGILFAVGILIAGASGLCSLGLLFMGGGSMGENLSTLPLVLMIGGIPCAIGAAMGYGGWKLIQQARKEREQTDDKIAETFE